MGVADQNQARPKRQRLFKDNLILSCGQMSPDRRLRLNDYHDSQNRREQSLQPHQKQTLRVPQSYSPRGLAAQDDELFAQDQGFRFRSRP